MILTTSTAPQSVFSFPTATSLPSPSADTNTAPLGAGWRSFTVSDFYLTLPERWVSVDVNRETIKSILYSAENLNPEWVQNVIAQVSANDFPEMTKFWAMDAQPAGGVYALGNVALWVFSSPQSSESVCVEMPPVYQEMGVELLKAECGLEINQLDVARLTTRHTLPSLTVMQDEYYYVRENKSWVLTLSVEATQYENFSEIFDTIAGSFRLVDDHLAADPTALTPYREAGGKIAFASDRDGNLEIYVMDADGGNPTRLTDNPAEDTDPSLSPDGQKIVFASARDGNWEIYVMNADGSDTIRLTDHPAREADPAWSPDGQKIVFSSNRDGDSTLNSVNSEIYVMAADGSAPTRLTYDPADDSIPNWSPDMEKIVFNSNRDGDGNIYIMNADGSNQIRITSDPGVDGYPVWSPDGQWIVYNTNRDGNWEIYGVSADGSVQTNLSNDPADDGFPEWSANGQKIVFSSARNGNWEIYLMNADGSDPAPLTNDPGYDSYPDLSSLTDQGGNQSSLAPSTATPVPALPQGPSPTAIQFVSIVSHEDLLTSLSALWLEFAILPGDILPGSQIEAALDNGFLELTLPGGEVKTFPQVPPATSDLKAASFENYGSVPSGPQIRIPLETLADISMVGRYQVTWQSGMMHSNTVTFEWDGTQIIVFEP
jgi:Tol biopolymer transport system component